MITRNSPILFTEGGKSQSIKGWTPIAYGFRAFELADRESGYMRFHGTFLPALSILRREFGHPLQVNSCCRTPSHNANEGGHPRSLHLTSNPVHPTDGAMAIDFKVSGWDGSVLQDLIDTAWDLGWSIGHGYMEDNEKVVDGGFLHLDRRVDIGLPLHEFYY